MIEITAKLCRESVYFINETIRCLITFTNNAEEQNDNVEQLAWACVQIYCQCIVDENKINIANTKDLNLINDNLAEASGRSTSFQPYKGERGHVVYLTKAKILFCDLTLLPNESKRYLYQEQIQTRAPPSYHGTSVKYIYKLSIGTQRVNHPTQLLRIPLRILKINQSNDQSPDEEIASDNGYENESETNSSDIFPAMNVIKDNTLELLLHKLDCLTTRRSQSSYVITNQLGKVVNFSIFKTAFKLGEDIIGMFDFSECNVPCIQVIKLAFQN